MLNILMLPRYDAMGASSRLRMLQYAPMLRGYGIDVDIAPLLGDGYVSGVYSGRVSIRKVAKSYLRRLGRMVSSRRYDMIWVEKELWPWVPAWLEGLPLPRRPALALDFDDAIFHRYDQHRSTVVRTLLGGKIDRMMRRADLVTAGNDYLARRATSAGCRHVEWLPTVVDLERYPRRVREHEPKRSDVVIGWIGSPSTAGYLRLMVPALEALARSHKLRCVAIGARDDQLLGTPFESLPWSEEAETDMLGQLDIGVMPLADGPWERGKCGYKLIQYMASGLPVVASPVGVNPTIVQPGVNGLLPACDAEWVEALEQMILDPSLRSSLGAAGRRLVERVYSLQAQAPRLSDMLHAVAGRERR